MATTTTHYGFDIPQSTDLVKDGATAIATLGQDIDTAMNTALGTKKSGLVLLNTTSFSGVASQSFNNVFSATYDNYKIVASNLIMSGGLASITFRLRKAGVDNSSNIYYRQVIETDGASISTNRAQDTSWRFTEQLSTSAGAVSMDIFNPNQASKFTAYSALDIQRAVTLPRIFIEGCYHNLNSSADFDGFTLIASSGTFSGELSVYGYNK